MPKPPSVIPHGRSYPSPPVFDLLTVAATVNGMGDGTTYGQVRETGTSAPDSNGRRCAGLVDAVIRRLCDVEFDTPTKEPILYAYVKNQPNQPNQSQPAYWPRMTTVMDGVAARGDPHTREVAEELIARGCLVVHLGDRMRAGRGERWGAGECVARREQDRRGRDERPTLTPAAHQAWPNRPTVAGGPAMGEPVGWPRGDDAIECSECGALVRADDEHYAWRVHVAWHQHADDVERTLTSLLESLGMVSADGVVSIPPTTNSGSST